MPRAGWVTAAAVLTAGAPLVLANAYARHVVITALLFSFPAIGLNLVFGYAGQHAFGHPVFFGVGAYASALLAMRAGWPVPGAIGGAVVVSSMVAAVVGYPCFRLRGIYFGVATFAFARVIYLVSQNWIALTRGPMGLPSIPPLDLRAVAEPLGLSQEAAFYLLVVAVLGVTWVGVARVIRSPVGRAWTAIRENEALAASTGIRVLCYKMLAFVVGAAVAGLGGALYAHYVSFVSPTELSFHYIGVVFIMMIGGGTATLTGPLVGALVFGVLPEVLRVAEVARNLVLGSLLLLSIAFLPEGLVGLWARVWRTRGAFAFTPREAVAVSSRSLGRAPVRAGAHPLRVYGLTKHFGGLVALRDVTFTVEPREIVGVIGPNGAGKTTAFNIISGFLHPTAGEVRYGDQLISGWSPAAIARLGVVRTFQITSLFPDLTAAENVRIGAHLWAHRGWRALMLRAASYRLREREIEREVDELLELLRLREFRDVPARSLPYGAQRGLELAVALATRAPLLLLDEPAAGLNPEETSWLRGVLRDLRASGHTIALIEHDVPLVMELCDRLIVLNHGEKIAEGPPRQVASEPAVLQAYLGMERSRA